MSDIHQFRRGREAAQKRYESRQQRQKVSSVERDLEEHAILWHQGPAGHIKQWFRKGWNELVVACDQDPENYLWEHPDALEHDNDLPPTPVLPVAPRVSRRKRKRISSDKKPNPPTADSTVCIFPDAFRTRAH